jgi:hypothetical protein
MKVLACLLSLLIALVTLSCGGGLSSTNSSTAQIRIMQASGDLGNMDVQINGNNIANNVGWRQTFPVPATSYISVQPGAVHYQEFATGTTSPALVDTQLALSANTFYTIITGGEESTSSVSTILLTDDHVAPAAGEVRLRFVNAASSFGPIDLNFASGPNGGPSSFSLGYKSSTGYLSFSGTSVQLCVSWGGSGSSGPGLIGSGGGCSMSIGLNFQSPPQNSLTYVFVEPPTVPPNSSSGGGFILATPTFASLPF